MGAPAQYDLASVPGAGDIDGIGVIGADRGNHNAADVGVSAGKNATGLHGEEGAVAAVVAHTEIGSDVPSAGDIGGGANVVISTQLNSITGNGATGLHGEGAVANDAHLEFS